MTFVRVLSSAYRETVREPESDDSWDRGDSRTEWSVEGLRITDKSGYHVLEIDAKEGDELYLLYAIYSTGDSFGHDENDCIEFFSLHRDTKVAEENKRALENGSEVILTMDDGALLPISWLPWNGYFESLTSINVEKFVVENRK